MYFHLADDSPQPILDGGELQHELVMEGTNIVTEPVNGDDSGTLPADDTTDKQGSPSEHLTDAPTQATGPEAAMPQEPIPEETSSTS